VTHWIALLLAAHCHPGQCDVVKGFQPGYFNSEAECQKSIGQVLLDDDPIWECYQIHPADRSAKKITGEPK
jgi:hypothetical protein